MRTQCAGADMAGQIGHQILHHADWPHAGAAAAVRNAKGFVQIKVADIATKLARRGHAH